MRRSGRPPFTPPPGFALGLLPGFAVAPLVDPAAALELRLFFLVDADLTVAHVKEHGAECLVIGTGKRQHVGGDAEFAFAC